MRKTKTFDYQTQRARHSISHLFSYSSGHNGQKAIQQFPCANDSLAHSDSASLSAYSIVCCSSEVYESTAMKEKKCLFNQQLAGFSARSPRTRALDSVESVIFGHFKDISIFILLSFRPYRDGHRVTQRNFATFIGLAWQCDVLHDTFLSV